MLARATSPSRRVFERVEMKTGVRITNASVIRRVWDNQSEFQADVLVAIAQDEARPEVGGAVDAIAAELSHLDLSTPESRSRALREVCRIGGNASSAAIAKSTNWSLWITVIAMATATTTPEQQRRIKTALTGGYQSVAEFWNKNYVALMEILGLRHPPALDHVAVHDGGHRVLRGMLAASAHH